MSSLERNYSIFEFELLNPLRGHTLTDLESYIASLLLGASAEKPVTNEEIRIAVKLKLGTSIKERAVKDVIRTLRKERSFPIIASRTRPAGYWWCNSKQEM